MPMQSDVVTVEDRSDIEVAAQMFRGFGDPTRLAILTELLAGERRVVDLVAAVGGSQSNVSGHLACLKECGLVLDRPEGRAVHYRLASPAVVDLLRQAEVLLGEIGESVALCRNHRMPR
jgi:DNA-binding transcriptional ArsR family regulator